MKFNKEEPALEENANETAVASISNGSALSSEDIKSKYYCPNCTMLMISFQDNSVQCELLTDTKSGPLLDIINEINSGSRRGSVQSMTEVMEDVPFDKGVTTTDESLPPDEILLVTRSFENQAAPQKPRRSSIAVFFDTIKSIGQRRKSDPPSSSENGDNCENYEAQNGAIHKTKMPEKSLSCDDLKSMGNNIHRKSFQLDNGTVVEEETAEFDAEKAVSTNEELVPGEVNFISRSFEIVPDYQPVRRESLIDKINPLKLIEKIRRGSPTQAQSDVESDEEEPMETLAACSGIRRKSLAPALLLGGITEEDDEEDAADSEESSGAVDDKENLAQDNDSLLCMDTSRYVTSGIRRGSVAAVSAAPPCRDGAEEKQTQTEQNHLNSGGNTDKGRYVTDGIRRGSVAMVSAAPPCICPDADKGNEWSTTQNDTELRVDGEDVLRSGVRRRSLTPANDGSSRPSSPVPAKRVTIESAPDLAALARDAESEAERERKSSDAADEFMNRVTKRYTGKGDEKRERKKGAVSLVEKLTGREMGVDYSSIDAKRIQEKLDAEFDEKEQKAQRTSIPTITFSEDNDIDDTNGEPDVEMATKEELDEEEVKMEEGEETVKESDDFKDEKPEQAE